MTLLKTLQSSLASCVFPHTSKTFADLAISLTLDHPEHPTSLLVESPFAIHPYVSELNQRILSRIPDDAPSLDLQYRHCIPSYQTQLPGSALKGVKNVIAIASGKGGVGKSTLAANIAITLARFGARTGLLDADIYGPSIPHMFGIQTRPESDGDKYHPVPAYGVEVMSIGLLTQNEPALMWRGPMLAKSLLQMMNATLWDNLDYLIVDLPPGTGDIQLSLVQKIPLAGAVIITTPQQIATIDAEKAIKMFQRTNIPVLGIIENMSMHRCSQCSHQEAIFDGNGIDDLCKNYTLDCFAKLPLAREIQEDCDKGQPTAVSNHQENAKYFNQIALQLSIALCQRPLNRNTDKPQS